MRTLQLPQKAHKAQKRLVAAMLRYVFRGRTNPSIPRLSAGLRGPRRSLRLNSSPPFSFFFVCFVADNSFRSSPSYPSTGFVDTRPNRTKPATSGARIDSSTKRILITRNTEIRSHISEPKIHKPRKNILHLQRQMMYTMRNGFLVGYGDSRGVMLSNVSL